LLSYGSVRRLRRCRLRFSLVRPLLASCAVPASARLWLSSGWRSQRTGREMGEVRGLCVMARGSPRWAGCSEWWRHLVGVAPPCTGGRFPNPSPLLIRPLNSTQIAENAFHSLEWRLRELTTYGPVLAVAPGPHAGLFRTARPFQGSKATGLTTATRNWVHVHWSGVWGTWSVVTVSSWRACRRDVRRPSRDPSKCLVRRRGERDGRG